MHKVNRRLAWPNGDVHCQCTCDVCSMALTMRYARTAEALPSGSMLKRIPVRPNRGNSNSVARVAALHKHARHLYIPVFPKHFLGHCETFSSLSVAFNVAALRTTRNLADANRSRVSVTTHEYFLNQPAFIRLPAHTLCPKKWRHHTHGGNSNSVKS